MSLETRIGRLESQAKEPAVRTWADLISYRGQGLLVASDEMADLIRMADR